VFQLAIDAIVRPFVESRASSGRKALWVFFLIGAPLAWLLGIALANVANGPNRSLVEGDRWAVLAQARKLASSQGLDVSNWREAVTLVTDDNHAVYLRVHRDQGEISERLRRVAPASLAQVLLVDPNKDQWLKALYHGTKLRGFEFGGAALRLPPPSEIETPRELAERAWNEWYPNPTGLIVGEPEETHASDPKTGATNRFVWNIAVEGLPDIEFQLATEIRNGRVLRQELTPRHSPEFVNAYIQPISVRDDLFGFAQILFIFFGMLYACYRYARRAIEKEAPHARVIGIIAAVLLVGVIMILLDPFAGAPRVRPEVMSGAIYRLVLVGALAGILLQAAALGIGYGSGEGDIREAFPDKMTSVDAILLGKVLSRNAGAATITGVAVAMWLTPVFWGLLILIRPWADRVPYQLLSYGFSRHSWTMALAFLTLTGLFSAVLGLLVPLTFFKRHLHDKRWLALLLAAAAFIGVNLGEGSRPLSAEHALERACLAVALLVPFFLFDFLASVVSAVSFTFFLAVFSLPTLMPMWDGVDEFMHAVAGVVVAVALFAVYRGRQYDEEEVRPPHARNLARRLSIQAELTMAREAQLRLLPDRLPNLPGLSMAASCLPAGDVRGDFYDIYSAPDGAVGILVAEGGNDGLASALTIALAKGFLLYEWERSHNPVHLLRRLEAALGENLRRNTGATGVGLFVIDPGRSRLDMARVGPYPRLEVMSSDGSVRDLAPGLVRDGLLERASVELHPGDCLLLYTDGLPGYLERSGHLSAASFLRTCAGFQAIPSAQLLLELIHKAVLPDGKTPASGLPDDLTALAIQVTGVIDDRQENAA
jgi:hypothetical protein